MTRNLLAILCLLPLAFTVGCEDSSNGGNGGEADADTDADSDSDTDADSDFEAAIVATIPFEGVGVFVSDDSGAVVKDAAFCEGMICTYQVPETGRYDVEAEDTFTFVPKSVNVDKAGVFQVSWDEGGCASDPEWAADGPCGEWVPGEYAFPMLEGSYTDEIWGREVDVEVEVDGSVELIGLASYDATMSGSYFYGFNEADNWIAGEVLNEETFSMVHLNAISGSIDEFLFHRD